MKPGRKLVEGGPDACTDADLLAILIGSGGPGYDALSSARALLEKSGSLGALMGRPLSELAEVRGVGVVRAVRIAAAYALAARLVRELETMPR